MTRTAADPSNEHGIAFFEILKDRFRCSVPCLALYESDGLPLFTGCADLSSVHLIAKSEVDRPFTPEGVSLEFRLTS